MSVHADVQLAPLPTALRPKLFAFPFTFAQKLDACGIHQQMQANRTALVAHLHVQAKLSSAQGAVVGHWPVHTRQAQQRLHQTALLAHSARPNRFLLVRQNWMTASENLGLRPLSLLAATNQAMFLSNQTMSDLRALSAAL